MNNNMLISTAMLNAYWEKENKDTLDLIVPFVKYCIAKTTRVNSVVNTSAIQKYLKTEFGYDAIPLQVINLILKRLSPNTLVKNRGEYTLIVSLDSESAKFEKKRTEFKRRRADVCAALKVYLNNCSMHKEYTDDATMSALMLFFADNGMCIMQNPSALELLKRSSGSEQYFIGQFLLDEHKKGSAVFDYVLDMVKGFFVSTTISQQARHTAVQAKFKGLKCYIDTKIILDALGLHLPEEKASAQELLGMLKENNASLACFRHTFEEVRNILAAYKNGLINPYQNKSPHTLVAFDRNNCTVSEVENYIALLHNKVEALGISVLDGPVISEESEYPFSFSALVDYIKTKINYSREKAIELDVESVGSILSLRNGSRNTEIEKCGHIFVTSNLLLCSTVNAFLSKNRICRFEDEAVPIIADISLSSIVWLKCFATHRDYPLQKLIECASAALEPTEEMLSTFFEMMERIQADGGISEDAAAIIRADQFCRKELAHRAAGDPNNINEQTVYEIRDAFIKRETGNLSDEAKYNFTLYKEEQARNIKARERAAEEIRKLRDKSQRCATKALKVIKWVVAALLFIITATLAVCNITANRAASIALCLIDIAGIADGIVSKFNYVNKLIGCIAKRYADYRADKKRTEYEKLIGDGFEFYSSKDVSF